MKAQDINIKLNLRTFCLYEQMVGKSYMYCNTEEDIRKLIYCSFVINDPSFKDVTYNVFENLINNEKMGKAIYKKLEQLKKFNDQFIKMGEKDNEEGEGDNEAPMMNDLVAMLIIKYHLDPRYVYYDMEMWELTNYFKMINSVEKEELIEKRFWTWLSMTPQIDTKKCKSPDKLLPFAFEEEEKKKAAEKKLAQEQDKVLKMFDMLNKSNKEEDKKDEE